MARGHRHGNDVYTTINAKAQKVALDALAGQCGAAVALNPRTGATLVMASSPTYNPNLIEKEFVKIGPPRPRAAAPRRS